MCVGGGGEREEAIKKLTYTDKNSNLGGCNIITKIMLC